MRRPDDQEVVVRVDSLDHLRRSTTKGHYVMTAAEAADFVRRSLTYPSTGRIEIFPVDSVSRGIRRV